MNGEEKLGVKTLAEAAGRAVKHSRMGLAISWSIIGNIVYAFSQWGVLISISKIGSTAMVGEFALGLAISAPIYMFLNFQLRAIQASDAKDQFTFQQYCGLRVSSSALAFLLSGLIAFCTSYPLEQKLVIIMIALAKGIESISDISYGLLQKHEHMERIAKSLIVRGLATLFVISGILYFSGNLMAALSGQCLVWLGVLLLYDVKHASKIAHFRPDFDQRRLRPLLWEGLSMGGTSLLTSLNTNIPRYFIGHYHGTFALGIYIAIESFTAVPQTLADALSHSMMPQMAKNFARGEKDKFRLVLRKLMIIGVVMAILQVVVAIFAGKFVLTLMYTADYAPYAFLLAGFMVLSAVLNFQTFLNMSVNSIRVFRKQLPINAAKLLFILCASALLIPQHHIAGALLALLISAVFSVVAFAVLLGRGLRQEPKEG